jgi:hypothetical protein
MVKIVSLLQAASSPVFLSFSKIIHILGVAIAGLWRTVFGCGERILRSSK